MNDDLVKGLDALYEKATKGPLHFCDELGITDRLDRQLYQLISAVSNKQRKADGQLYAALVNAFPAIVAELEARDGWIPVSERLPDKRDEYYLCSDGVVVWQEHFNLSGRFGTILNHKAVTHWMPLPQPPAMLAKTKGEG